MSTKFLEAFIFPVLVSIVSAALLAIGVIITGSDPADAIAITRYELSIPTGRIDKTINAVTGEVTEKSKKEAYDRLYDLDTYITLYEIQNNNNFVVDDLVGWIRQDGIVISGSGQKYSIDNPSSEPLKLSLPPSSTSKIVVLSKGYQDTREDRFAAGNNEVFIWDGSDSFVASLSDPLIFYPQKFVTRHQFLTFSLVSVGVFGIALFVVGLLFEIVTLKPKWKARLTSDEAVAEKLALHDLIGTMDAGRATGIRTKAQSLKSKWGIP
ncbi:hypothetical protein [Rhizobium sp. BK176]|uniref:hypothetical protein n=1 Tax=Rhizobium sp. BK176 TaxID=2587071 RepID=UPI0021679661|nr:hypothetical protein [Rhizobium sp. BK176]MCS4089290.1 hypothetical protein [Rhizobium sp. BK176]